MSGKNQEEFQKLVQKYLDDTASAKERDVLDRYYLLFGDEPARTSLLNDQELILLEQRIESGLFARVRRPMKVRRLWPRIVAAAAIVVVVFGAGLFVYKHQQMTGKSIVAHANDVVPGKVGATLTLASGKKISLAEAVNGEIAKEAGISVTKTADGQIVYQIKESSSDENKINTLTTAKGETYMLILPDKSRVWMNAASSLTYAAGLRKGGFRRVKLEGEAYFKVEKDKQHPFIVESGNQQVEVLGTEFNVNAYRDEKVSKTTLLEGSVTLSENGESRKLVPGTQAVNANGHIKVSAVDTELAVAWKNNKFIFERLPIQEIMRIISRWYNVEIIYQGDVPEGTFWGSVSRYDNISKVLVTLETAGGVHFKIEGRKIYVSK